MMNPNMTEIVRTPLNTDIFQLKPVLINMVQSNQFGGTPHEDLNTHLASFLELCDTVNSVEFLTILLN